MSGPGAELLFGPMLIGVLLSTTCYGIMTLQMFIYYQTYKKDIIWIRYFVLYLFIAETINLLFEIGIIYEPLIIRYGSPRALIVSPLLLPADAISIVLVSTPIQIFTAWRISVITGKKIFTILISVFALVSFVGGALVGVFAGLRNEFRQFQSFDGIVSLWLISSAVCDVLITIILTYSLTARKTGFTAVDGQVNRIIRLTVQTGAITAVAALADLILFLTFPKTTLQFIPDFPLSKFYSICLISSLNARSSGKGDVEQQRLPNALFKESTGMSSGSVVSGTREFASGVHVMTSPTHVYPPPMHYHSSQISGSTLIASKSSSSNLNSDSKSRPRVRPRSKSQPPSRRNSFDDQDGDGDASDKEDGGQQFRMQAIELHPTPAGREYIQPRPRMDSAASSPWVQHPQQVPTMMEARRAPPATWGNQI
ncbi:hypothetical protein C8F01DRAFT_1371784 [Mycena amicta]|nr:hypothetical protein C8F01DRAFT_1371784 [Mycena amicta]